MLPRIEGSNPGARRLRPVPAKSERIAITSLHYQKGGVAVNGAIVYSDLCAQRARDGGDEMHVKLVEDHAVQVNMDSFTDSFSLPIIDVLLDCISVPVLKLEEGTHVSESMPSDVCQSFHFVAKGFSERGDLRGSDIEGRQLLEMFQVVFYAHDLVVSLPEQVDVGAWNRQPLCFHFVCSRSTFLFLQSCAERVCRRICFQRPVKDDA